MEETLIMKIVMIFCPSQTLPLFVCPPVTVDRVITLPPEPLDMEVLNSDEEEKEIITITPPASHNPPGPVSCRLISYELREGQVRFLGASAISSDLRFVGHVRF